MNLILTELNNRNENNIGGRQLGHQSVCVWCGISISRRTGRRSRPLTDDHPERAYVAGIISPRQVNMYIKYLHFICTSVYQNTHLLKALFQIPPNGRACNACWQRAHSNIPQVIEPPRESQETSDNVESRSSSVAAPVSTFSSQIDMDIVQNENVLVELEGYSRTPNSSNHCFVPDCTNSERLRVPIYIKKQILIDYKLYVSPNARVCEEHASVYNWELLTEYQFTTQFTQTHIVEMLDLLRKQTVKIIDFENVENMNNHICRYWTGLTVLNFLALLSCITSELSNICKKPKTALGLYLMKIRTGEPIRRIASLMSMNKSAACSYMKKARHCLNEFYVPRHLGVNHIPRTSLSSRNLLIPQGLFGTAENNPIIICDGTYIYLQKSSNYLFQKKSYSLHKFANLVKPFLLVATDGHIIDIFGPYAATTSDATIMRLLFQNENSELRQYFRQNDVFILDRGFRDSIPLLTSLGYTVCKPETLSAGETQLSTEKANKSRLVTLCRWVVEVANGRFKRDFKIFRNKYFNLGSQNLMNDFKIAGAILNHFHPVLTDHPDAQTILERANQRMNMQNYLANHVIRHQLNRHRASFVHINAQMPQLNVFPIMEMSDLVLFSLGIYQIKQAHSYYGEHIRPNGTFTVEVSEDVQLINIPGISSSHETVLIRGRIKSRHISSRVYYTYILLKVAETNWQNCISDYYCSCIIGKRTVGSCAHVMTIVWYLGWARHQNNISPPAQFLDSILIREDVENEENQ